MNSTKLVTTLVIGALLVPVAGYAAEKSMTQSTKEAVSDSVITTKIKADFAKDKAVSAMRIKVDTDNKGVVTLSGTAKSKAESDQFAAAWSKDHPKDLGFRVYLADAALARNDYAAAEAGYRDIVAVAPNHATSLNNIAYLLLKQNKPGAMPFAEKANELQPNQALLMDTMALALAADKRVDQAIELQKKALALSPESSTLKLTMARLHVQAGQKPQARELLESLTKLGDKLPEQAEVKSLLASL